MRALLSAVLAVAVLTATCGPSGSPQRPKSLPTLKQDDQAVMQTVLLAFLADHEFSSRASTSVLLKRLSPEKVGMVMQDQVNQYLRDHRVPEEMVRALYERNNDRAGKEFAAIRCDFGAISFDKKIQVVEELPSGWVDTKTERWMESYAPAYSSDRNTAVVRTWIGPTAHGAIATYLLRREDDAWRVDWREFTFFV